MSSRPVLGPTGPPIRYVPWALSSGVNWPWREAESWPQLMPRLRTLVFIFLLSHMPCTYIFIISYALYLYFCYLICLVFIFLLSHMPCIYIFIISYALYLYFYYLICLVFVFLLSHMPSKGQLIFCKKKYPLQNMVQIRI
jgi:hypothetical protein